MESEPFYDLVEEIENYLGYLLGVRVYTAISNENGEIKFARDDFIKENMIPFITNFVQTNFSLLGVGDHSFPMSNKSIGFFKISEKSMIILYAKGVKLGSLLAFKTKMFNYAPKIDEKIGEITKITIKRKVEITKEITISKESAPSPSDKPQYAQVTSKKFARLPRLIKELTGREKFPINDVKVLRLCDGKHTIKDIIKETKISRLAVESVIRNYQKKKYISLKRTTI
ncbi:MAG: hypothetical protein HWN67_13775 [Candidatus Helarchaeota archaeon]|nr:hypothetical protein [Candidatus Helarchaeota archaeon]